MNGKAPVAAEAPEIPADAQAVGVRKLVLKNALFLSLAQTAAMPLSIVMNAMMARHLGPAALGYMYLGSTLNACGFLAVDWGQGGALPALVARDRSAAGSLLGSSLTWRLAMAVVVFGVVSIVCRALGYAPEVRTAVSILFVGAFIGAIVNGCQDTITGFERTDITAIRQFGDQFIAALVVIPILWLGGNLDTALCGLVGSQLIMLVFVTRSLRPAGVGRLSFDSGALKKLIAAGTPFVFFSVAMVLQPNIDAVFLSKLSPPNVVGWHAAARKLIGFLVFPASALIGALYPTLCRLHATDREAFRNTANGALRGTSLLVMPVALGCALYPEIGTTVYGRSAFSETEDNLRVLSAFLFLMYFTMPLGVSLLAAGRQRAWAAVQSLCVVVSSVLDPVLIPWFQRRNGNGGLGICVAAVVSEVFVVLCGLWLAPKGLFDRRFWRTLLSAALSGAAMAVVARLLRSFNPFVAAPFAVVAYVVALRLTGGLEQAYVDAIRGFFARKLLRGRSSAAAE